MENGARVFHELISFFFDITEEGGHKSCLYSSKNINVPDPKDNHDYVQANEMNFHLKGNGTGRSGPSSGVPQVNTCTLINVKSNKNYTFQLLVTPQSNTRVLPLLTFNHVNQTGVTFPVPYQEDTIFTIAGFDGVTIQNTDTFLVKAGDDTSCILSNLSDSGNSSTSSPTSSSSSPPPTTTSSSPPPSLTQNSSSNKFSGGTIAGIVIGILVGLFILMGVLYSQIRRRFRSQQPRISIDPHADAGSERSFDPYATENRNMSQISPFTKSADQAGERVAETRAVQPSEGVSALAGEEVIDVSPSYSQLNGGRGRNGNTGVVTEDDRFDDPSDFR